MVMVIESKAQGVKAVTVVTVSAQQSWRMEVVAVVMVTASRVGG